MFPVYFILECDSNIQFYKRLLVGFQFQRFQESVKHTCKIKVSNR